MPKQQPPSFIDWYSSCLPVLDRLSDFLGDKSALKGVRIGWHCHLTEITAVAATVLVKTGAHIHMSECNPDTTSEPAVKYMRSLGLEIHTGASSTAKVLSAKPQILSDTGAELISAYLESGGSSVFGASEITTSGITRLRFLPKLSLPVIDINSGKLKTAIENFHGVGSGVVDALKQLSGQLLAGHCVTVIGYGRVGAGSAHYLKREGAAVTVVESDPVRALSAHYDGFRLGKLQEALASAEVVVTATGCPGVLSDEQWHWCKDGAMIMNVGHWANELDLNALKKIASAHKVGEHLQEFRFSGKQAKSIYIAANGSPANVAMLSGSPEPTLIHLTTELACMNYLTQLLSSKRVLGPAILTIPPEVEELTARLALAALSCE
jgi:adenosylhomocysteinase